MNGACLIIVVISTIAILSSTVRLANDITLFAQTKRKTWQAEFCQRGRAELSAVGKNIEAAATVLNDPVIATRAAEWQEHLYLHQEALEQSSICAGQSEANQFVPAQQYNPALPEVWPNWVVKRSEAGE